jgi:hypothetical protein
MRPQSYDRLRRDVRTAVFRACRLRADGHAARADEQLADELAAAQAQLASDGMNDAAAVVGDWVEGDEAAFAQAQLTSELLFERLPRAENGPAPLSADRPGPPSATPPRPAVGGVPGLADLLEDMLAQERRPKPRPS